MPEQLSVEEDPAHQIAKTLDEPNIALIRRIIKVIGVERTKAFLAQAQATITQGGLLHKDSP